MQPVAVPAIFSWGGWPGAKKFCCAEGAKRGAAGAELIEGVRGAS
jgi:hypothetical protein